MTWKHAVGKETLSSAHPTYDVFSWTYDILIHHLNTGTGGICGYRISPDRRRTERNPTFTDRIHGRIQQSRFSSSDFPRERMLAKVYRTVWFGLLSFVDVPTHSSLVSIALIWSPQVVETSHVYSFRENLFFVTATYQGIRGIWTSESRSAAHSETLFAFGTRNKERYRSEYFFKRERWSSLIDSDRASGEGCCVHRLF